jgi:hypothetical protein
MATNDMTTAKSKHIDIRYNFIREVVKSKADVVLYCPTGDMLADALNRFSLPTDLHLHLVGRMLSGTYPRPKKDTGGYHVSRTHHMSEKHGGVFKATAQDGTHEPL